MINDLINNKKSALVTGTFTQKPSSGLKPSPNLGMDSTAGVEENWLNGTKDSASSLEVTPISPGELWAMARRSPKGRFLTNHMAQLAFKDRWFFTEPDSSEDEPLQNEVLSKKLALLTKKYKIHSVHTKAVEIARTLGNALVIKWPERGLNTKFSLRIIPLKPEHIFYDKDGFIDYYLPQIMIGRAYQSFKINWKDAVLYTNDPNVNNNGYLGTSALEGCYYDLLWMQNILETWATIMHQRGLGYLDFTVEGAEEPQLQLYKDEYGDPSAYAVLFHDEKMKINAVQTVSSQINIDQIISVYTKEVSSASGVGEARLNGVQQGRVTGSETDGDNLAAILQNIEAEFNDELLAVYALCDPSVSEKFGCGYEFSIKMDKQKTASILSTNAGTVNQLLEFLTYNQALGILGMPPVADGDVICAEYFALHGFTEKTGENPEGTSEEGKESSPEKPEEAEKEAKYIPNEEGAKNEDSEEEDLEESVETRESKEKAARELLQKGYSYREINKELKAKGGTGLSNTVLLKLREELAKKGK